MGYIKKLKNNELVGGTDKTTIYPVTSTEAVFEEITNGNESSFKSQKTINKEQQDELDDHEERIQAAEAEDIKSITINGSTKKFEVDDENNVDLTIYTVDNDPEMPSIASNVEDLRNMVGTSTPVLETSHKTRIETLEGGESVTGSVENKIKTKVDSINSSYQDDNNEYVKYSMTQTSGEVTNFNIDETGLKNAITSLNTSISGDNIIVGPRPTTGLPGKIYRVVNSSNNTYTDYMYSNGSWIQLAIHDTSDEQAQVAYYTCTATGSGAQATKQFVGNGSLTYTPSSGGHIKILMGEANTATGTIYLQFGTTTSTKKPLYYNGESVSAENTWEAGETISVYYDPSANSNAGAYYASNAQGGGGKAEKIKYDNTQSGLAADNVQGAVDEIDANYISLITSDKMKLHTAFRIATNDGSTTTYATPLNLVKGKKYRIKLRTSAGYNNATLFILQLASNQYEGQKVVFNLPANNTSLEYDYFCNDDNYQYVAIYASGRHTITYDVTILEYLDNSENNIAGHEQRFVDYYMSIGDNVIAIGNSTQSMCIGVEGGQILHVTAGIGVAQIAFMTSVPEVLSNNMNLSNYVVKTVSLPAGESTEFVISSDVTVLWFNLSTYYNNALLLFQPEFYSIEASVQGGYGIEADNNYVRVGNTIQEDSFVEKNAFLSLGGNRAFAVNNNVLGKYLKVKSGECYRIVADQGHTAQIATMSSITNDIVNMQESSAIRNIKLAIGKEIIIRIEEGETILWFNVQTYYQNQYIRYDCSIYYAPNQYNKIGGKTMWLIPIYGQSLAIGGDTTKLTTKIKYPTLEYNTEEIQNVFTENKETSKNGLLDSAIDSFCKDNKVDYHNIHSSIVSFSYGQGSTSIIGLKKGTTLYSNFIAKIQAAYNNSGSKIVVPAFCWVQGEDDRFDTNTNDYKGELVQLRADLDADIKAITGQTEDVHCIVYQTNQLSIGGSHFKPNNYASGDNGALMSVPQAQYELIRDNALFHASTPIYMMAYYISSNGYAIHITNESQRLMGYYEGLQAQRLITGGSDIGLYVSSVTKVDSTHIKLNIHTPCPPLVIDIEQVYEVAGYGFSVITSNNENILQSVTIAPNHFSEQAIIIETSSDCTGAKVRYGVNGTIAINSSGFKTGSRGNIRDSQGLEYMADINGKKVPMHNWLYFFEYLID